MIWPKCPHSVSLAKHDWSRLGGKMRTDKVNTFACLQKCSSQEKLDSLLSQILFAHQCIAMCNNLGTDIQWKFQNCSCIGTFIKNRIISRLVFTWHVAACVHHAAVRWHTYSTNLYIRRNKRTHSVYGPIDSCQGFTKRSLASILIRCISS
jgi:hypothetical protein